MIADYLKPLFDEKWHDGQHEPHVIDPAERWVPCACSHKGVHRFAFTVQDHDGRAVKKSHDGTCQLCAGRGHHPRLQEVNIACTSIAVHEDRAQTVDLKPLIAQMQAAVDAGRSDLQPLLEHLTSADSQHASTSYLHNLEIWRLHTEEEARELLAARLANWEQAHVAEAQREHYRDIIRTGTDPIAVTRAHALLTGAI